MKARGHGGAADVQTLQRVAHNDLLQRHAPLVERIRLAYGSTAAQFATEVAPLLQGYADYVHTLPAAPRGAFSGPEGLLGLGLETGLYCLQGAEARIFTGHATISERRSDEPRWRLAALVAGLCCELHTAARCSVQHPDGGCWPCHAIALRQWLQPQARADCSITWRSDAARPALNGFLLHLVVPPPMLALLAADGGPVLAALVAALCGLAPPGPPNPLAQLLRSALAVVLASCADPGADPDAPVEHARIGRFVVQAMRALAAEHAQWQPNAPRSRVWVQPEGLYLQWPEAVHDLQQWLLDEQVCGLPGEAPQWRQLLWLAGVLQDPATVPLASIQPPSPGAALQAVKLSHPGWLFDLQRVAWPPVPLGPDPSSAGSPPAATDPPAEGPASDPQVRIATAPDAGPPAEPAEPPRPAPHPQWQLQAPLRLPVRIRDALMAMVEGLEQEPAPRAWLLTDGLFVSADAWMERGVSVQSAARGLQSCGMLPGTPQGEAALAVRRTPEGEFLGTLVDCRFLRPRTPPEHGGAQPC